MKKTLTAIVLIFLALAARADTVTPRMGLVQPAINSPGWGLKLNNDLQIIDSSAVISGSTTPVTGTQTFPQGVAASTFSATTNGSLAQPAFNFAGETAGMGLTRYIQPTWSIAPSSINTSTNQFFQPVHGLFATSAVLVSSTGTLPSGLTAGTTYFIVYIDANDFGLATQASSIAKVSLGTTGTGNTVITPLPTHDLVVIANGVIVLDVSTGSYNNSGEPLTGGQVYIGGRTIAPQPSEVIHAEGSGDTSGDYSADIIMYNTHPAGHAARVITQSNGNTPGAWNVVSYMQSFGAGDSGSFWTGGPSVTNGASIEFQNASAMYYTALNGGSSTYFYTPYSTATWTFNSGTNGYPVMNIGQTGTTVYGNLTATGTISGSIADSSLSSNVMLLASTQTATAAKTFVSTVAVNGPLVANGTASSSGQTLISNGPTAAPSWTALAGTRILQIVSSATVISQTSTSSSYADTKLTATITPSSTSSKIFVLVMQTFEYDGAGVQAGWQLLRAGSIVNGPFTAAYDATSTQVDFGATMFYLDSPATTSPTIYKTQFARVAGSSNLQVNPSLVPNPQSVIYLIEIE